MTVGPYRPIHLHTYKTRIADVYVKALVSPTPELACAIEITPTLHGGVSDVSKFDISLRRPDGSAVRTQTFDSGHKVEWKLDDGEVSLWWPVGYGQQTLYHVDIAAISKVVPMPGVLHMELHFLTRIHLGWHEARSSNQTNWVPSR